MPTTAAQNKLNQRFAFAGEKLGLSLAVVEIFLLICAGLEEKCWGNSGVLLTVITNPSGLLEEQFGATVTGIGTEWIAVGTPYVSEVLLTSFTSIG